MRSGTPPKPRARKGTGSLRRLGPDAWKLTVTGLHADGSTYRLYRTVHVDTEEGAPASRVLRSDLPAFLALDHLHRLTSSELPAE